VGLIRHGRRARLPDIQTPGHAGYISVGHG